MVELPLTEVLSDNRVFRFDAQYFAKTALQIEATLKEGVWCELIGATDRVDSFGAYALTNKYSYVEEGVPFLRCLNIRQGFTNFSDVLYISEKANKLLSKSEIQPGMVLLTMSGSVGNAAVALPNWMYPVNSNQDIAKITPKQGVDSYYLAAFLGSKYGRAQMERLPVGSVQQHIFLWMIEKLVIRRLTPETELTIGKAVSDAYSLEQAAVEGIQQAEQTLLRALGLENWQPPEPLTYTRPSRDAFAAGRLDAEYFAPRVAKLLGRLKRDGLILGGVAPVRHERFIPGATDTFDYIEIGGVRADGTVVSETVPLAEAPSRATWLVRSGDVITSTVRPIRRLSALVAPEQDGHVCSSGFVVLRPEAIPAEVLLTYLRLPQVCELLDLHTSASLYPAISEVDLLAMPMPRIDAATQAQIVAAVRAAQASRRRAAELLDAAKRAVEIAIEESETAALAWLEEVTGTLADPAASCDPSANQEPHHDHPTTATPRPASEAMARRPSGRSQPACGLSRPGAGVHPEFHGPGAGAGGPGPAARLADSTQPLDATRELSTAAGSLTYTEVAERLAVNIVRCLDAILDAEPETLAFSPDWLRDVHRLLAGELFPDWAGQFRTTDVQVGTHFPPPAHAVAVRVKEFCLDLEERLRHLADAKSIAGLLAWVDWRFQWIHPFKDFNGRVGRILLVALAYKLGLPPMDPAGTADKDAYFTALRAADVGDLTPLREIWLRRLAL